MPSRSGTKITSLTADFSGVEERRGGGAAAHVQEGDYLLKLKDVEVRQNEKKDGQHVKWVWGIEKGPEKSTRPVYDNTSLKPEALWKLYNVLTDLREGKPLPKKALNIDFSKYIGKLIGATLADGEPYNGKVKSEIVATFPASEYADEDVDDDEEAADLTSDEDEEGEELETEELEDVDDDI